MTVPDLTIIVPTRSRPESVGRVIRAWEATDAFEIADLLFVVDADDPGISDYVNAITGRARFLVAPTWRPLVPKLNAAARDIAFPRHGEQAPFALGFAGDDHLPRTAGWAQAYVSRLRELGTGIVYCDDGYQGRKLATQWAMTSDIVRALGRMVPAPVEHLFCDNSVSDLGRAAGCLDYLDQCLIEHMNPYAARKAEMDEQYARVNSPEQYRRDRPTYKRWLRTAAAHDARIVRDLKTREG